MLEFNNNAESEENNTENSSTVIGLCPNCGAEISAGQEFCPICGEPLDKIIIPSGPPREKRFLKYRKYLLAGAGLLLLLIAFLIIVRIRDREHERELAELRESTQKQALAESEARSKAEDEARKQAEDAAKAKEEARQAAAEKEAAEQKAAEADAAAQKAAEEKEAARQEAEKAAEEAEKAKQAKEAAAEAAEKEKKAKEEAEKAAAEAAENAKKAKEEADRLAAEKAAAERAAAEKAAAENNWQQAYYDYFLANYSGVDYPPTFGLFDIDGDAIPEAAVGFNGTGRFEQVSLFTYYDGEVCPLGEIGSFSTFYYSPGKNRIRNDMPAAAFHGYVVVQHIAAGELVTDYAFSLDTMNEEYSMGMPDELSPCTEQQLNDKMSTFFPEGSTRSTPNLLFDDNIYHCTKEDLALILNNPDAVTY